MTIVKSKHASNYTVLPNEIFTCGLSIEAIGLLSYFLSLPKDWVIYKTQLHTQLNVGRERLDRIFKELTTKGYVLSVKEVDEKGHFTYNHIVYDKPFNGEPSTELPLTDKPLTGLPYTADQPLQSKNIQSTKEQSKEYKDSMFEIFWDLYDKKVDSKKCKEKFLRLKDAEIEKIFLTLPDYIKSTPDVKFRKNPSTYLNNQCWNDEVVIHKEELRDYPSHLNPPKAGCQWRNVGNTWMQVIAPQPEL